MRVHFYEVSVQESDKELDEIVQAIDALQPSAKMVQVARGMEIRLESVRTRRHGQLIAGDLVRLRMTEIPSKVRRAGGTSDIPLLPDEGLGEHAAFLYRRDLRLLVMQSNRTAVTASAAAAYFTRLNSEHASVQLTPIVDLAKIEELDDLKSVSRLELAFTADSDLASLQPPSSLGGIIAAGNAIAAPVLTVSLSVGRDWRKKSLNRTGVRSLATFMLMKGSNHLTSLKIVGRSPSEEQSVLDMMKGRLSHEATLRTAERRASFGERLAILEQAHDHAIDTGKIKDWKDAAT
jgi:hypothetical protein